VTGFTVFLAGSIEQGKAVDWQARVASELAQVDVTLFNPRRDHWDATLEQSKHNAKFREQVQWELDALERADVVMFYFDAKTQSPITLLELGLFARSGKAMCVCPDGFWRKGNVRPRARVLLQCVDVTRGSG
jgi:nucleoside 2-deoxyribosyltransferase